MENFGLFTDGNDDGTFVPFTDILFNALLGFAFMVFIAFSLINPAAKAGTVNIKAEYLINVQWPDSNPDDIDTYVRGPDGKMVWYHEKEIGLMHLDRDDRGNYRDTLTINGKTLENPLNQETISIRGIVPGEYVVNVFDYASNTGQPVPVKVMVQKVNPSLVTVYEGTVTLEKKGDEKTAVRFTVSRDGGFDNVTTNRPVSLVQGLLQGNR